MKLKKICAFISLGILSVCLLNGCGADKEKVSDKDLNKEGIENISGSNKETTESLSGVFEDIGGLEPLAKENISAVDNQISNNIDIYFENKQNWNKVFFYEYNSETGDCETEWPGKEITDKTKNDEFEYDLFSDNIDVVKYDRIIFNNGEEDKTIEVYLSKASSVYSPSILDFANDESWLLNNYSLDNSLKGNLTTVELPYKTDGKTGNYNKKIWIWTPVDYDENSEYPYKTIYVMDGQNLFDTDYQDMHGSWRISNSVEAYMNNGGRGIILVGIDNSSGWRDSELTPAIAENVDRDKDDFTELTGEKFSEFVINTVMPYVRGKYNSSLAREDNCIAGSSSGGLEAFYIGVEHPEKFGTIGALSPAFLLFFEEKWNCYLDELKALRDENIILPKLYIYTGTGDFEETIYPDTMDMYNRLTDGTYNYGSEIKLSVMEKAAHNEAYWRNSFAELLGMFLENN